MMQQDHCFENGIPDTSHYFNPKTYDGMPLSELLSQSAIYIENYMSDHHSSYDGVRDSLYVQDVRLARLLNRAAQHNKPDSHRSAKPRTYNGAPLHSLISDAAEFVENFMEEHPDSYEGPTDNLYIEDKRLIRLLRQAEKRNTPKPKKGL